jgi:hypothetical protein
LTGPNGIIATATTTNFPYKGVVDGMYLSQIGKYTVKSTPDGFEGKAKS